MGQQHNLLQLCGFLALVALGAYSLAAGFQQEFDYRGLHGGSPFVWLNKPEWIAVGVTCLAGAWLLLRWKPEPSYRRESIGQVPSRTPHRVATKKFTAKEAGEALLHLTYVNRFDFVVEQAEKLSQECPAWKDRISYELCILDASMVRFAAGRCLPQASGLRAAIIRAFNASFCAKLAEIYQDYKFANSGDVFSRMQTRFAAYCGTVADFSAEEPSTLGLRLRDDERIRDHCLEFCQPFCVLYCRCFSGAGNRLQSALPARKRPNSSKIASAFCAAIQTPAISGSIVSDVVGCTIHD